MLLKLAWRNIWRNKRRTFITATSVLFAVVFAVSLSSVKEGMMERILNNLVKSNTGFVRIHEDGYWKDQTLEKSFYPDSLLSENLKEKSGISYFVPRIETISLGASDSVSRPVMITGIDPEAEQELSGLHKRVSQGEYLSEGDQAVLIGKRLSEYLGLNVGDTLVLIGRGYHSISATGKYPVKGILNLASAEQDKAAVYLPIKEADYLFDLNGRVTVLIPSVSNFQQSEKISSRLQSLTGPKYEVMSWRELLPALENLFEGDKAEGIIMTGILYMVIAFGLFGTVTMMLAERRKEFGVLVAVGMKRWKLSVVVTLELVILSFAGSVAGMIAALPGVIMVHMNPIPLGDETAKVYEDLGFEPVIQTSTDPDIFISQGLAVLIISVLIGLYPFIRLINFNPMEALHR